MIETNQAYSESLFLDKENENYVYINDCHNLKQHQIDGLRFLYRQFKKGKLGAVLNFPPGSGKSLIVTLFINAVSSLLKERVLITCTDDEEIEYWKELFLSWTEYSIDEIAIESSNPRVKKKIFLKKVDDLTSYSRCKWSVVVIKDDVTKSLQKISLDADLKIWLTSTDIKKDHSLLSFIYKWMFPKSKININDILNNEVNSESKLTQAYILDSFLEDFVLRENNVAAVSDTKNVRILQEYKDSKTRKNKDATGTKIKRSKRIPGNESNKPTNIPTDNLNISEDKITNVLKTENDSDGIKIKNEIVSNKSSLRDDSNANKPLGIDETIKIEGTSDTQKYREAIDDKVINENKPVECNEESTESLDFGEPKLCIVEQNSDSILDIQNTFFDKKITFENDSISIGNEISNVILPTNDKSYTNMDFNDSIETEKSERGQNVLKQKITELEERTMKKFKGSLLDSIF